MHANFRWVIVITNKQTKNKQTKHLDKINGEKINEPNVIQLYFEGAISGYIKHVWLPVMVRGLNHSSRRQSLIKDHNIPLKD